LARRNFLKISAFSATGLTFAKLPAMAGPFESLNEYLEATVRFFRNGHF